MPVVVNLKTLSGQQFSGTFDQDTQCTLEHVASTLLSQGVCRGADTPHQLRFVFKGNLWSADDKLSQLSSIRALDAPMDVYVLEPASQSGQTSTASSDDEDPTGINAGEAPAEGTSDRGYASNSASEATRHAPDSPHTDDQNSTPQDTATASREDRTGPSTVNAQSTVGRNEETGIAPDACVVVTDAVSEVSRRIARGEAGSQVLAGIGGMLALLLLVGICIPEVFNTRAWVMWSVLSAFYGIVAQSWLRDAAAAGKVDRERRMRQGGRAGAANG